jgi:superfamily II DNA or RNA helicase
MKKPGAPSHPSASRFIQSGLFSNLKTFSELESRIEKLPTAKNKGDAFEVFAEAYLNLLSLEKFKYIWVDRKIPPKVRAKLKLSPKDAGVDGIIETISGRYRGYQVKFRSDRKSLTYADTATFFGLTDCCDDRLLFTNAEDISGIAEERSDFGSIRGTDLDKLSPSDFVQILNWLKNKRVSFKKKNPRPHQKQALKAIIPAFKTNDRVTAVMACGTGKTFVSLWVAESVASKTVLVLVPSLALLRQTLKEWVQNTSWGKYDFLCVCSDATVSQGEDELIVKPTELEFSVTTDPAKVKKFIKHRFDGVKIIFSTYQSAEVVARGMPARFSFDFAVFDEAHKTAGFQGTSFNFGLENKNLAIKKRLFLTATPRHYNLQKKDPMGDPVLAYSMDQPDVYGPVVFNLSFAEAARRKIICDYKVIISVITSPMIDQHFLNRGQVILKRQPIIARQAANQLALKNALEKHDIKKIFTFHHNVASAKSFSSEGSEGVSYHFPNFHVNHVNGTMTTAYREKVMEEFKHAETGLLSNARCLTEGIDVPAVDMVAFMSPKKSKVDIVQAIGRAMRTSPKKEKGYIFIPLYLEQAKNESIESALERSNFQEIWAVLQAIQEQDEVFDQIIQQLNASIKLKRKGFNDLRLLEKLEIIGPTISVKKLQKSITTMVVSRLGKSWETMFQMLLMFKKKHGHTNVPVKAKKPWAELGIWVDKVRALKRNNKLKSDRLEQLNKIGFRWLVDGQTLENTNELLNIFQFIKKSKLWSIKSYLKRGLIKPAGYGISKGGISPYFHPQQIKELKNILGITIDCTNGLVNEAKLAKATGLTRISGYRKKGLIKPIGYAMTLGGRVSAFYAPNQIVELKKKLGITLENTKGLLNEAQIREAFSITQIQNYRKKGLIKPVGYALNNSGVAPYYHPSQIEELKVKLGITLDNTKGLLNESEFRTQSQFWMINFYRKKGLIKPVGYALNNSGVRPYYHPCQIKELKKKLGITLDDTAGLLNEAQIRETFSITQIQNYRKKGLIKPVGYALNNSGVAPYYHPSQIEELKVKLGITLDNTKGLLNEKQIRKILGFSKIGNYRKKGLIKPIGYALNNSGLRPYYHPCQIKELKKKLGITLDDTTGLLSENQFGKVSGFTGISIYRKKGLVKPVGVGFSKSNLSFSHYYRPNQIDELKKKLGITLDDTAGLLNEAQIRETFSITQIQNYRKKGLIKPVGYALNNSGVAPYYHPRQIKELKNKLGITLDDTAGLLSENQFRKVSSLFRVSVYRNKGLIKPIGYALNSSGAGPYYHPRQINELKNKLGITLDNTKGLLNERQIRNIRGFSEIAKYRKKRLIQPLGYAMSATKISPFYHPRQIKELKAKLQKMADKKARL